MRQHHPRLPLADEEQLWIDWGMGEVHMIGTPVPRHDEPEVIEQRYLIQYLGACQQTNLRYAAIQQQQKRAAVM